MSDHEKPSKQYAIRFPRAIADEMESRVRETVSGFVITAVQEKLERDRDAEVAASLACLADDPEASDISDFARPQAKVIARGD